MILLDTDTCIEILRGNKEVIQARSKAEDMVAMSFMSVGELYYGAEKSSNRKTNLDLVDEFMLSVDIIHTDLDILKKFGEIKAILQTKGLSLPDADCLIAATCLTKCTKLITGNTKHFIRIETLITENWIR